MPSRHAQPRSRRPHIGLLALGLVMTAAACSAGAESAGEGVLADGQITSVQAADTDADADGADADGSEGASEQPADTDSDPIAGDDAAASEGSDDRADGDGPVDADAVTGGPCTAIQFPFDRFASVLNLPASDAEGLAVRSAPDGSSELVGTLATAAVVETGFHSDIRCATDTDGAVWWYVYGGDAKGWANSKYLAEHNDEQPPADLVPVSREDDRLPSYDADIGPCRWAQFPSFNYATIANIPADDPDGGLNLRAEPSSDSAKVGTLPTDSEAATGFHSNIRCAVAPDGAVWWYLYGSGIEGWGNSAFLADAGTEAG